MTGICYVAPDVEIPSARGSATHVLELSAALSETGSEVHVICSRSKGQPPLEEIRGVKFHRFYRLPGGLRSGSGGKRPPSLDSSAEGALSRAYRVYLQTVNALRIGVRASRLVKKFRLNIVIERETAYGAGAVASLISGRPLLLEIIGPRTSRLSIRRCFRLLAYSPLMVPEVGRRKAEYVEAAVNTELFRPDNRAGEQIRSKYALGNNIVIGYVGTFQAVHGIHDLLMAASMALKQMPALKFLMVGPRQEQAVAAVNQHGIANSVIFTGPVPYEEVYCYLNASDILVAPYNVENTDRRVFGIGSPLKVLEYLAVGKPTIGSSLPQIEAIIENERTGILFPQGDRRELARAILRLAGDPVLRETLGRNGYEMVRKKYSWCSFARQIQATLVEGTK